LPLTRTNRFHTPDSVVSAICLRRYARVWRRLAWRVLHAVTGGRCDGTEPATSPARSARTGVVVTSPAHPPCCRGRLACVPPLPTGTLAVRGELSPLPPEHRRQVCSLLRLSSRSLAESCPCLLFRRAHMYVAVGKFLWPEGQRRITCLSW
jgi:hypothetical protein